MIRGSQREIVSKATAALMVKLLAAGAAFALNVAVARALGAHGAGLFALATTAVLILATLARLGFDNTMVRHVAGAVALGQGQDAVATFRAARVLIIALATGFALAMWFGAAPVAEAFGEAGLVPLLQVIVPAIPAIAFYMLCASGLRGLKATAASMTVMSVVAPASALAIIAVMALVGVVLDVDGVIVAYIVGCAVAALLGAYLWRRHTDGFVTPGRSALGELLRAAPTMLWITLAQQLLVWVTVWSLGRFATPVEVGLFNAAQRTALLVSFVLIATNAIAGPRFAELHRSGDRRGLADAVRVSSLLTAAIAVPACLPLLFAPAWVMSVFGAEFSAGAAALVIVTLGQLVNVLTGSVGTLLVMSGNERDSRLNVTISAATCVALNLLLVPRIGLIGAAVAYASALALQNLLACVAVYRRLGIVTILGIGRREGR
jgi:O-antigen/teichoic acid export membrane protein